VLDIASAHIAALQKNESAGHPAYKSDWGTAIQSAKCADAVEKVVGHRLPIHVAGRRPGDPAVLCAVPMRRNSGNGWSPKHSSLEEIITSAWRWKRNPCAAKLPPACRSHADRPRPVRISFGVWHRSARLF